MSRGSCRKASWVSYPHILSAIHPSAIHPSDQKFIIIHSPNQSATATRAPLGLGWTLGFRVQSLASPLHHHETHAVSDTWVCVSEHTDRLESVGERKPASVDHLTPRAEPLEDGAAVVVPDLRSRTPQS
eukprot:1583060-Rhodomonas_salina.4